MGFATGFTGGVTLTLSLAYLAVLTHQRNRQAQSDILRAQHAVLSSLTHEPASSRALPSQPGSVLRADKSHHFVETLKDRWNAEIQSAVRWAQTKDWNEVREEAEGVLARVWRTLSGSKPVEVVKQEASKDVAVMKSETEALKAETVKEAGKAKVTTKSALEEAKEKSKDLIETTKEKTKAVAEQGKAAVVRGIEKSKEVVDQAKAVVGLAEEKAESKLEAKLLHLSEIDRALAERYQDSRGDVMRKTVDEVLAERYKPVEQIDRSKLKAV